MTQIFVKYIDLLHLCIFRHLTKNRTPTPVYLDPGMHSGLDVKGLSEIHQIKTAPFIAIIEGSSEIKKKLRLSANILVFNKFISRLSHCGKRYPDTTSSG